jgi:hypothetical protein
MSSITRFLAFTAGGEGSGLETLSADKDGSDNKVARAICGMVMIQHKTTNAQTNVRVW